MDDKLFRLINGLSARYSLLDSIMIMASNKVRYLFGLVMIVMYFKNHFYRKVTFNALISLVVTLIISFTLNLFFYKPRPFIKRRVGILIPSKMNSTFPSKHTTLVFAISTSIFLRDRILGAAMFILSALTGFSRIWVGHHYPSDIVGSAFIGSFTGFAVEKATRLNQEKEKYNEPNWVS